MATSPVTVKRPAVLTTLVGLVVCAFAVAGAGVVLMGQARMAPAPDVLLDEGDVIAEALDQAPWIGGPTDGRAMSGLTVWALAPAKCDLCAEFHRTAVARLSADGAALKVLVFPDQSAALDRATAVATMAKDRRWALYRAFAADNPADFVAQSPPADGAEIEGLALWARASAERLTALGVPLDMPVVMWRAGDGWRMLTGPAALDAGNANRAIAIDLAALRG